MTPSSVRIGGDVTNHSGAAFVGNPSFHAENINIGHQQDADPYQCLQMLYSSDSGAEKRRLEAAEERRIEESYTWILRSRPFEDWLVNDRYQILRIIGGPGKGKTMLMTGIVDYLSTQLGISPEPIAMSYFFCQAADDRLNNASAIVKGLLHNLLAQTANSSLIHYLQEKFEKRGARMFEGSSACFILQEIFVDILQDRNYQKIYFVVDGLDECNDNQDLLHLIRETSLRSSKVKWLVSSRRDVKIDEIFSSLDRQVAILLESHNNEVGDALDIYIDTKVASINTRKKYGSKQVEEITRILKRKANGTFLWVNLACKDLIRGRSTRAVEILNRIPTGLTAVYERMERIIETSQDEDRQLCSLILSTVTIALRPLRLKELMTITGTLDEGEQGMIESLDRCGSFLSLQGEGGLEEHSVYFVHQSAQEYLAQKAKITGLIVGRDLLGSHWAIVENSLQQISKTLQQDICSLVLPGFLLADIPNEKLAPIAFLTYACCHWCSHLSWTVSEEYYSTAERLVDSFLGKDYLHWIEFLCLFGKVAEGVGEVRKLRALFKPGTSISHKMRDAESFLIENQVIFETAPLQVYSSALLFSPRGSWTKMNYSVVVPSWVTRKPFMYENWEGCLRVFEVGGTRIPAQYNYNRIMQVVYAAFSPCGQLIAVVPRLHVDVIFQRNGLILTLWDVNTGIREASADLGDALPHTSMLQVLGMEFTESGSNIVITAGHLCHNTDRDRFTISLYNRKAELLKIGFPFEEYVSDAWLESLSHGAGRKAFFPSPNGAQVVARCGGKVFLMNMLDGDGKFLQGERFTIHTSDVQRLKFSPNSRYLATVSASGTEVWDAQSGSRVFEIRPGVSRFGSVAFSHDSTRFVAAYETTSQPENTNIEVWSLVDGCHRQKTLHLPPFVRDIAFSWTGHRLVCNHRRRIKVFTFDIDTGKPLLACAGLYSCALPDGRFIIPESNDTGSFLIWNPDTNNGIKIDSRDPKTSNAALAPAGDILATSLGTTITLWDVKIDATGSSPQRGPTHLEIKNVGEVPSETSPSVKIPTDPRVQEELRRSLEIPRLQTCYPGKAKPYARGRTLISSLSSNGTKLALVLSSGTIVITDPVTEALLNAPIFEDLGKLLGPLRDNPNVMSAIVFSDDARMLVLILGLSYKCLKLKMYDLSLPEVSERSIELNLHKESLHEELGKYWTHDRYVAPYIVLVENSKVVAAVSPDNSTVVISTEVTIHHWIPTTGEHRSTRRPIQGKCLAAKYSTDGQLVGFAYGDAYTAAPKDIRAVTVLYDPYLGQVVAKASCQHTLYSSSRIDAYEISFYDNNTRIKSGNTTFRIHRSEEDQKGHAFSMVCDHEDERGSSNRRSSISFLGDWLYVGDTAVLRIPPSYKVAEYARNDKGMVAAVCSNGRIYSLGIDTDALAKITGIY